MQIKEIIEKAISGGWKLNLKYIEDFKFTGDVSNGDVEFKSIYDDSNFSYISQEVILLDPKFWENAGYNKSTMLDMVEHLWSGGSVESFIKTL